MKTKLIVNPASGQETAIGHLPAINARLREAGDVDIVLTTGEGDGVEAGRRAALEGYDRVFVAGGDGTLNEVLNGVAQVDGALGADHARASCRSGRATTSPRRIGVPGSPEDAVDALLGGAVAPVDVGRVNDRCFLNISAGGFIADVSDAVNPQLKTVLGKLAYLVGGAQVLLDYEPRRGPRRQRPRPSTRGLAARVRRVQLTADRRRPPDRPACHRRRRLAGRLPDSRDADAGVRGAAAPRVERRSRRRRSRHLLPHPGARARLRSCGPDQHRRPGARGRPVPLRGAAWSGARAAAANASGDRRERCAARATARAIVHRFQPPLRWLW